LCAEEERAEGNLEDAIEAFESLLKLDKTDTDPRIRAEATSSPIRARNELRKNRERLLEISSERVTGFLLTYLIPLLALGSLVAFRIAVNFLPRKGIEVSLSDLSAESGTAGTNSRSLTAELLFLLEDPEPLAVRGLQMNTMPGTGQPAFGVIRPAQAMTLASEFSASKYPMKIGCLLNLVSTIFFNSSAVPSGVPAMERSSAG